MNPAGRQPGGSSNGNVVQQSAGQINPLGMLQPCLSRGMRLGLACSQAGRQALATAARQRPP